MMSDATPGREQNRNDVVAKEVKTVKRSAALSKFLTNSAQPKLEDKERY